MLVTSIFSFSHYVFYPFQNEFQFLSHVYFFSSAYAFNLEQSENLLFVKRVYPLPDMPILGFSNSAANIDMMLKIRQMEIKLSESVENIVGKGEIAPYEQFLLFPQCFQKLSVVDESK